MAIIRLGALRFAGLNADVGSLPIDVNLDGAIFDATDTTQKYVSDGTQWTEFSGGGAGTTFQPAYQFAVDVDDVAVEEISNVWRLPIDFTSLSSITGYVETAPTGSSITILIKKNAVTEATLIIGTGSLTGSTSTFTSGSILTTDEITVEVTTIGSTTPGSNLKLSIIDGVQSTTKSMQFAVSIADEDVATGLAADVWRTPTTISTIIFITAYVQVAPVGSAIILEVKKDGVTEATLTIAAGSKTSTSGAITSGVLEFSNEVTVDVTQVGSTTPGQNLKVSIVGS